jgi:hypothetical protein
MFSGFLQAVIDERLNNDQKALNFEVLGLEPSFDCNPDIQYVEKDQEFWNRRKPRRESSSKFCFLNEFVFQNGKVGLHCAQGRGGSMSEFLIGMHQFGLTINGEKEFPTQTNPVHIVPAVLHANFADNKRYEFSARGLWLYNDTSETHSCLPLDINSALQINWQNDLPKAQTDVKNALKAFYNSSAIKLPRPNNKLLYMVVDDRPPFSLCSFPDDETFYKMGYNDSSLHFIGSYSFLKFIHIGYDLPSLK